MYKATIVFVTKDEEEIRTNVDLANGEHALEVVQSVSVIQEAVKGEMDIYLNICFNPSEE